MNVAYAKYNEVGYSVNSIFIIFPIYLPLSTSAQSSSGMLMNLSAILPLMCCK